MGKSRIVESFKKIVLSFRLKELRKCYDILGLEASKKSRKAEMQYKIITILRKLIRNRVRNIPLQFLGKIYGLAREMKKERSERRRKKLSEMTSNRSVTLHADIPKSPFFEIVEILISDTITSKAIFNVKIPNQFLPQLRRKKSGMYSYDVQLLFIDERNTRWNSPTISYQVNDGAKVEALHSPPIIYIIKYCTLRKNTRNEIKVTFPFAKQEFKVIVSVVKRLDPSHLVTIHPVKKALKTEELVRKRCEEENVYACTILLVRPDDDEDDKTITQPCRSSFCNHPEVFDLMRFLEKMQYFMKWCCPVCTRPITYESLEVDTYFAPFIQRGIVSFTFHKQKEVKNTNYEEVSLTEDIIYLD